MTVVGLSLQEIVIKCTEKQKLIGYYCFYILQSTEVQTIIAILGGSPSQVYNELVLHWSLILVMPAIRNFYK
jgi:hypothetical protein